MLAVALVFILTFVHRYSFFLLCFKFDCKVLAEGSAVAKKAAQLFLRRVKGYEKRRRLSLCLGRFLCRLTQTYTAVAFPYVQDALEQSACNLSFTYSVPVLQGLNQKVLHIHALLLHILCKAKHIAVPFYFISAG
ncbi:hypothetical protein [Pontibacter ummariensis]|uniref:hypothetical protein n=1 Tax=Pontibacter ummariensis TaxID=1610492 RepID=UPI00118669C5|nr:hypothetical protein [Pontibacter ummariensis]